MCYYRLYIFLGCGHTTLSARSVRPCAAVRSKQRSKSHPAKTEQGASLKESSQVSQSPPATLPDGVHTTDFATFHTSHNIATNSSSHPHTEDANTSQEPVTSRLDSDVDAAADEECEDLLTHPFQTFSIHTSCALCLRRRAALLQQFEEETSTVRFEDWRWKVKYLSPTPEEARYSAEWGNVGSVMGSWVKDWKTKGDGFLGALRDQAADDEGKRDSATGGLGIGIAGMLSPGRKKGKAKGSGSVGSSKAGNRGWVTSS